MAVTSRRHFARTLGFITVLALLAFPAFASIIVTREIDSKALARKWSYNVYQPDGYESGTLRYPVLYLLHGNNGNYNDWAEQGRIQATADELMTSGQIPPAIIVMPADAPGGTPPAAVRSITKVKTSTAVISPF